MDKDKIEEGVLLAQEGMLLNKINIQMLLQLLVEKGVITRKEVAAKREYVSGQPKYKNLLNEIYSLQKKNREEQYFTQEFSKFLNSDGKQGDVDYLKKILENK